jgi:transposase-like protein
MKRSSTKDALFVNLDRTKEQELLELLPIDLKRAVKEGMGEYLADGIRFLINLFMETEVNQLCGKRYERNGNGIGRWGSEAGSVIVGRTKELVDKPRVRRRAGGKSAEVNLKTYGAFNNRGDLSQNILNSVLAGVSTRRYAQTVEKELQKHGISKSSVSRHAIEATKPLVDAFLARPLEELNLISLFIDGIHIGQCQVVVCIGVGYGGRKYVLGIKPGATENEVVCRDLLRDLKDRGLKENNKYLFAIDGSQALANAIRAAFGNKTAIQRCQEHKIRDIQSYLPVKLRNTYRMKLQAAWSEKTEKKALERLHDIRSELLNISEAAANSLTEGMLDTVTLHRLKVGGELRKSLRTTNVIESAFSSVRKLTAKPTRYRNESEIVRWLARGLCEVEKHFQLVRGNRQLTALRQALEGTTKKNSEVK